MKRFVLLLCIIVLSVFFHVNELFAEDIENNLENNTSNEIEEITTDTKNTIEKPKPSLKDILGDEQKFPFVAGFGSD